MQPILVEIAAGELVDKITILQIKLARLADPAKLANVRHELGVLQAVYADAFTPSPRLEQLTGELRSVNEAIWVIEDDIRDLDRRQIHDARFIQMARDVHQANERRATLKREISLLRGGGILEEKSYVN
jgi:hypothetical protein